MVGPGPNNPGPYDDDWEGAAADNLFMKWGVGVGVAAVLVTYAIVCLATGSTHLPGRHNDGMTVRGTSGVALALAWLGGGMVLHCHYFWGNIYHLHVAATIGKIAGLLMFVGGLGVVLVRVGVLGR